MIPWRFFIIILLPNAAVYAASLSPSSSSCNYSAQTCGNLSIPFPFGISPECGLPQYRVSCKQDPAYGPGFHAFLQNISSPSQLHVLNFSISPFHLLVNATQLKAMPSPDNCDNPDYFQELLIQLPPDGPFVLSGSNFFAVIGCSSDGTCDFSTGNVTSRANGNVSCTAGCYNQYGLTFCNYYACCVNGINTGMRGVRLYGNGVSYKDFPGVCGFSTLIYPPSFSVAGHGGLIGGGQYGILLTWGIKLDNSSQNCATINSTDSYACHADATCSDVIAYHSLYAYTCSCRSGYTGDGYRDAIGCHDMHECNDEHLNTCAPSPAGECINTVGSYYCRCKPGYTGDGNTTGTGCQDIDECQDKYKNHCETSPRGNCINTPGSYECRCSAGYVGDGRRGNCKLASVVIPAVVGSLGSAAFLVLLIVVGYGSRRAYLIRRRRSENFLKNGGEELGWRSLVFSEEELKKATDNFSRERELGKGGFGTVYWGVLPPPQGKVAIKKAKHMADGDVEAEQVKSFVAEIAVLGKVRHPNVVKLLGCCVETSVPLLVYEFVDNGSVWDHLHNAPYKGISPVSRSWAHRLDVAVGTAAALSHLYSMDPPIIHRDVKSANILLDASYSPKVADFGASCSLLSGATHITFAEGAMGTVGYLDPEYHDTFRVTDRSDVYSFGVVLLELLTSRLPLLGPELGLLAHHFRQEYRARNLWSLVDSGLVVEEGKQAATSVMASQEAVAEVAMMCLVKEGRERPAMEDVWRRLREIQRKHGLKVAAANVNNEGGVKNGVEYVGVGESSEAAASEDGGSGGGGDIGNTKGSNLLSSGSLRSDSFVYVE